MEWQTIINFGLSCVIAALGWFAREIWDAIKELRKDIKDIEQSLPENYVRRDDFKDSMTDVREDMREGFREVKELIGAVFKRLDSKQDR